MGGDRRPLWPDVAAVILAACLGVSYGAVLVIGALTPEHDAAAVWAPVATNLGGILAGALAGWLGASSHARRPLDDGDEPL